MPYGLEIYDANGKLVASSDQQSWVLRKTGTGTTITTVAGAGNDTPSVGEIDLTGLGYVNPIVAVACATGMCFLSGDPSGKIVYGCNGAVGTSFNYYVYDSSGTIPPANFGIELYDDAGNITFSSNHYMMKPLGLLSHDPSPVGSGGGGGPGAMFGPPNETLPSPTTYTGKSVAVAPTCWAGWYYVDPNGTCYDTQPGVSWEPGMRCSFLQLPLSHNMLGGSVTNSGQTAAIEIIPWENLTLSMLVIDVTNIPIGVTYY